ncbi:MAG TPA: sulfur transferase domain-containing protein [Vicinamibacterales bacterium]|nr:sulfur transferase domain-containing protein [Vicinamibacterales bacterium]
MSKPGISNYTQVDAVVACGGATETSALEGLENDGFKAVINLRQASERGANIEENRARAEALGLKYLHIPFNGGAPENKTFDDFLIAVADKSHQPVYIHCASANRVGAVWLAKRVLQDGWAVDKAAEEARLIGLSSAPLEAFALKYIEARKK